jgi:polar amino acid transport system ATP-binding protein/sulfate transport system ATP-binding protein
MSGGQRQRTAIVQQLLCSEHFILLDEPFSGLDPVAIEKLCKNITKVANRDDANTVLISTHILEPALAISDSIIMLGNDYTTDLPSHGMLSLEPVKLDNGAKIKYVYDLAANGLAWNPEIRKDPRFTELVEQIRTIFQTL